MQTQENDKRGRLWNPYLAGIVLGLVLLASFVIMGQGLGASGGVARVLIKSLDAVAHDFVANNGHFGHYVADGAEPLMNFMVFLGLGVLLGGFISALSGGRVKLQLERGPRASRRSRMIMAVLGGAIMGFAARLAYGCTSGQALTGGSTLAAGSWAFMLAVFAGGYAVAWFVRRQWI
jgi:uncharacterized protein